MAVQRELAPILAIAGDTGLHVLNRPQPQPRDARAALLNLGLAAAQGRYAAFLDYDDLVYPEAYRLLIGELQGGGAAIAFGGILNAAISRDGLLPYVTAKTRPFQGAGLAQLLHNNFCPVHSYVLDRRRIAPADLVVDEGLAALEDYDLLLRLCSRYSSSFRLKDKIIGEYLLKDDDGNINPLAHLSRADADWERRAKNHRRPQTASGAEPRGAGRSRHRRTRPDGRRLPGAPPPTGLTCGKTRGKRPMRPITRRTHAGHSFGHPIHPPGLRRGV